MSISSEFAVVIIHFCNLFTAKCFAVQVELHGKHNEGNNDVYLCGKT